MNKIVSKSNGKEIRGGRGQKRGPIVVDDLYRFLEERYGYSRKKAKEEVNRRIRK